jgi:hypothetical protein
MDAYKVMLKNYGRGIGMDEVMRWVSQRQDLKKSEEEIMTHY